MSKTLFISCLLFLRMSGQAQYNTKYVAMVGGIHSGQMSKNSFIVQEGVEGEFFVKGNHWESMIIDSFKIMAIRDSIALFYFQNYGSLFSNKLKSVFQLLKPIDRVLIFDIYGRNASGNKVYINPSEFILE